ncbi:hypothetical protein [Collinsella sp. An2]|uniref:hypothetical protein n=1 Tax=Collinsella sp. An2 TaxID=1965585 RepID=UPI000B3AB5B1|nr:hypothetical protein [Collinsella sp. An2]OUP06645.1 hypothetical protein B5F33_09955 [Collinsella sp. An2]
MLSLLASDLYRISRPRGLRGSLWQYLLAITAVYLLVASLFVLLKSPAFYDGLQIDPSALSTSALFTSPTGYLASMMGGIVPLCVAFMVVEAALADFKQGFVKTILSARSGRLSYFGEKILLGGVLAGIVVAFTALLVAVIGVILGYTFTNAETPADIAFWLVGFWINIWALSVIPLVLVYATRISPVSYIFAFCVCMGTFSQTLNGLAYSSGGLLRFLEPIAPVLKTLAAWMPSSSISRLSEGTTSLFLSTGSGPFGLDASGAFMIDPTAQTLLTGIIWIVLATVVVLSIARHRDI